MKQRKIIAKSLASFILLLLPFLGNVCLANNKPIGYLDSISGGVAVGWALDPDTPGASIGVHIYADGPAGGGGTIIGAVTANGARADVNSATGYSGNHGFSFNLPSQYQSGHSIYAYGIDLNDSTGASNVLLTGSPMGSGSFGWSATNSTNTAAPAATASANGDAQISATLDGSVLTLKTCSRTAGAVCSITWKGKEFINTSDHGREMQSASSFDNYGECFNPTEAGSMNDGTGSTSTSVLKSISASGNQLTTKTQMAFWLAPGQSSQYCPSGTSARNTTALSNHILDKKITLAYKGIPNVIEHQVTYTVPEAHSSATFEAVTGYMPSEFSKFWQYNPSTKQLSALSDGPDEISSPVILATPDGNYAMGIYSTGASFGRWKFTAEGVVKWNCVFRTGAISAGQSFTYKCYPIVGTLAEVTAAMDQLKSGVANTNTNTTTTTATNSSTSLNSKPIGFLDAASNGAAAGWALDPNSSNTSISVHIYADGPAGGGGTIIGAVTANGARADVNSATGYSGNHGFSFNLPSQYQSGHSIYAYGIDLNDSTGASNVLLTGSPKTSAPASSACVAKTCAALGDYECGTWSNGCSSTISCGDCGFGKVCSAGKCIDNCTAHASKKCEGNVLYWYNSCNKKESLYQDCAASSESCSNGACSTSQACVPKTCSSLEYSCGTASDGCSSTLFCGTCASGQTCSNNKCITAQACTANVASGCKVCNAQGTAWVDTDSKCASNQKCQNGTCITPYRCTPDEYSGCAKCSADGFGWLDDSDKCAANQKCSFGQCVSLSAPGSTPACTNECVGGIRRCASGSNMQVCGNYDSDSCTEWGSESSCASGKKCIAGICITSAANGTLSTGEIQEYIAQIKAMIESIIQQLRSLAGS